MSFNSEPLDGMDEIDESEISVFTLEDMQGNNLCQNCEHMDNCAILHSVNIMAMRRDGKKVDKFFGCTPFYKEIEL